MTDVLEDDEFGGFESADLDSVPVEPCLTEVPFVPTVAEAKPTSPGDAGSSKDGILSWIMANSPKMHPTSLVLDEGNSDAQNDPLSVLDSIVEKDVITTIKSAIETNTMKSTAGGWYKAEVSMDQKQEPSPGNPFTRSSDDPTGDSSEVIPNSFDDLFANYSKKSSNESVDDQNDKLWSLEEENSGKLTQSAELMESITAVKAAAVLEIEKEKNANEHALQELQARLDAAIVVKEQTGKSFEKLQVELKEMTSKVKADLEEKRLKHENEMGEVRKQHKEEIKILQKTSEETMKTISRQYKELWKAFEEEQQINQDMSANRIVEKCTEIMQLQHMALMQELEHSRIKQEDEVKQILDEERKKMGEEISSRVCEEKEKIQKEMNDHLKEVLSKEVKCLEEIHRTTLKESMYAEHKRFDELLASTLQCERDKFTDAIQDAVSNAQGEAEKSFAQRTKVEERRSRKHTTALKIFLTSALEQVDNLLPGNEERDSGS